jgi:hypothetical protein
MWFSDDPSRAAGVVRAYSLPLSALVTLDGPPA